MRWKIFLMTNDYLVGMHHATNSDRHLGRRREAQHLLAMFAILSSVSNNKKE
jgi:hypothetical protein